jgi:hypothetical protein
MVSYHSTSNRIGSLGGEVLTQDGQDLRNGGAIKLDYDGGRLVVGVRRVELVGEAIESLNKYMELRGCSGEEPMFVSESHLSRGQRLSYEGVREILGWLTEIDGVNGRSGSGLLVSWLTLCLD